MYDLLVKNCKLATPTGSKPKSGEQQGQIRVESGVSIGISEGKIAYVGAEAPEAHETADAGGRLVTPGLVDCHTHLVFGGWRQNELEMKLAGADYLSILAAGGGILSTVEATRAALPQELTLKAGEILDKMLDHGTTTLEAKSGYGLDSKTEFVQMLVAKALHEPYTMDVVSTFLGAHAVPPEFKGDPDGYIDFVISDVIPMVAQSGAAEFCDIFCEQGVFDINQSRRLLRAAIDAGLGAKIHADEIVSLGGAELAAELGAISAEHLIAASDSGLAAMARAGTIAVLLPTTSFYLGKPYARARDMLNLGIPVAIGSDFNPGSSPNFNLQLSMTLAYLQYRMYPAEILTAVTLNSACAINRGALKGTIEIGKDADIVIWDCPDLDYLLYRFGDNQVNTVIKNGVIV